MEDGNGLELSLGLSCGGSSGQSKIKDAPADHKVDEGSSNRLTDHNSTGSDPSFKKLFQTGTENPDQKGKQKTAPDIQQCENFWTDLGTMEDPSNDIPTNLSQLNRYQEHWASNKTTDADKNTNKRKMPFGDINFHNKHEKVVDYADAHGKSPTVANLMRNSHATENASSGVDNEDVAESEAEESNSWLVAQREEKSKSLDIPKFADKHVTCDSSGIGPNGQKYPSLLRNDSNHEPGKVTYGIPLSLQPVTVMTVPNPVPVKVPSNVTAPNVTGFPSTCVMQLMPVANSERPAVQTMSTSNLHLSFGYLPGQLPTLETGSSWAFNTHARHVTSHVNKDGAPNADHSDDVKASHGKCLKIKLDAFPFYLINASGTSQKCFMLHLSHLIIPVPVQALWSFSAGLGYEGKSIESAKCNVGDVGSYSQNGITNQPSVQNVSTIWPGIASEVKFGGCGSYPDLPWVSTTDPGPNGKTISGVTYKYNQNEVKIVCACHGTHMSPDEFIQHASGDSVNRETNTNLASASAKSCKS